MTYLAISESIIWLDHDFHKFEVGKCSIEQEGGQQPLVYLALSSLKFWFCLDLKVQLDRELRYLKLVPIKTQTKLKALLNQFWTAKFSKSLYR